MTLIELLVVILVIGILIGLLMPALGPLRHRGRVALADSGRSVLRDAIRQYHFEYGVWPIPYPPEITEFRDNNHLVLERLDVRHPDNRKEIRFLQTEDYHFDGDGNILDPWGRPYTIAFNLTRNRVAISYDTPPRN